MSQLAQTSAAATRHYRRPTQVWVVLVAAAAAAAIALVLALTSGGGGRGAVSPSASSRADRAAAGARLDHRGLSARAQGSLAVPRPSATRHDGGPEEGTRGPSQWATPPIAVNRSGAAHAGDPHSYNGGHDEGSAGH
jgi:hypothetical protein